MPPVDSDVSTATRPTLIVCAGRRTGVAPFLRCLAAHPDIGLIEPEDFRDVDGDAETFPLNTFAPAFTSAPGCADAFDAIAGRLAGRTRHIAWHPGYGLELPHVLTIAAEHLPDARLLVCLRNPIEAIVSHHRSSADGVPDDLDAAIDRSLEAMRQISRFEHRGKWRQELDQPSEIAMLMQSGVYFPAVDRALRMFASDSVRVVQYERLALDEIATFLEIPAEPLQATGLDDTAPLEITLATRRRLAEYFAPWNARLFQRLGWPLDTWTD